MDPKFLIYFLIVETFGLCFNVVTLIHILQKFEIKIHVFTMIFVDSILTVVGCIVSIILESLHLSNFIGRNTIYCTLLYSAAYVPFSCGAISTFLVAVVRYILTRKSARFVFIYFILYFRFQIFRTLLTYSYNNYHWGLANTC